MQIIHKYTSKVLCEDAATTIKESVIAAVASGADLRGADLSGAYLSGAYLSGADLSGAYLSGADLNGADLNGADLRRADLSVAYLSGAYLSGAYLRRADLSGADLNGADLRRADLSGADLNGADLRRADLSVAYLSGADLSRAKIQWSSHDLIAEILRRAAEGDVGKLSYAGLILILREWCWGDHLKLKHEQLEWTLRELAKWITPEDGHPECLDAYRVVESVVDASESAV